MVPMWDVAGSSHCSLELGDELLAVRQNRSAPVHSDRDGGDVDDGVTLRPHSRRLLFTQLDRSRV